MNSKLNTFVIKGLNSYKDVQIPFNSNIKLLIGENGTGKTTIMNILYYTLSRKFNKLLDYSFESIFLEFGNGEKIEITLEDVQNDASVMYRRLRRYLSEEDYNHVIDQLNTYGRINVDDFEKYLLSRRNYGERRRMPPKQLLYELDQLTIDNFRLINAKEIIKKHFPEEILYFPTYRRIEEELHNLGYKKDIETTKKENLIQFGMKDVEELFTSITSEIKDSTIQGFTKITANMINHLVGGQTATNEMKEKLRGYSYLSIILNRIGDNLEFNPKKIDDLIKTEEIFNDKVYNPLIYFLNNLIDNYEKHRDKDMTIKKFENVCNQYLKDKKVVYNENLVKLEILHNHNKKPVQLSKLSSGEKQIVSLFSKIYLSQLDQFIVLFDEPELSLSIDWQAKLLPDIIKSGKCNFLFSVTHSPFIYDNELDEFAKGINLYTSINEEKMVAFEYGNE